ncbi:hypothetical protein DAEQUDRAFT_174026 [Daedalea quercina L-15889]|uniref:Uncharacterized protein n=1 Tax=Daedalea quercina L-15889 TaxID=1314783 RepID=A0A165RC67_9APHY|nr:hypothetical protein DAEQUDRAFT_174026 [Daedalea quercina L-15889]
MSSDLVVLLVTLYYVSPRPWVRARLSSRSISRVLLRNGILYFCVLAILNALEIILYLTSTTDYVNIFIAPTSTVVIARFLLNIREAAYAPDTTFKSTNSHDLSISTQSESDSGTGMWQSLDFTTKANDYSQGTLSSGTDVGSYDRYLYADDAEFEMYTLPMAPRGKGATQNRVAAVVPQPEHAAQ